MDKHTWERMSHFCTYYTTSASNAAIALCKYRLFSAKEVNEDNAHCECASCVIFAK